MLDLGWSELLIIAVAALIVVGPKDLPRMLRTLGQYVARAKSVAREFQRSMDEAARQADIDELREVKKDLDSVRESQYRMQREMSQSFLDEGKAPKKKAEGTKAGDKTGAEPSRAESSDSEKAGAARPAAGNGDGDGAAKDEAPDAGRASAGAAPKAPAAPAAEAETGEPAPKGEPSAGKVGGA